VEAAAATALSTVDSDFGRTTDPVRMYMREMGAVALLTREGEIEIAKRIEGGLKDMIQAISACPTTIAEIVALARKIEADELKVDEVVDGFVDLNEANNAPAVAAAPAAPSDDDEEEEEEVEEEDGDANGGAAGFSTEQLAQLKKAALERSTSSRRSTTRCARPPAATAPRAMWRRRKRFRPNCWASASPPRSWKSCATRCAARWRSAPYRARRAGTVREQMRHAARPLHQGVPGQ
jgi:ribosomal protein L12E/L44/L45/RPP1/RPP2